MNLSDQQFVENTDVNPIVKDILNNKECQNNTTLQKLREKVAEMNLDELADVLLPVLVERLSPADILISQSRDGSTDNKIDLTKMDQNLSRCKRQLTARSRKKIRRLRLFFGIFLQFHRPNVPKLKWA